MIEIRHMQRDIERAQQFGPQIMEAVEARYQFEENIQDFLNENMPLILNAMKDGLDLMKSLLPYAAAIPQVIEGVGSILTFFVDLFSLSPFRHTQWIGDVINNLQQINTNTAATESSEATLDDQLARLRAAAGSAYRGERP